MYSSGKTGTCGPGQERWPNLHVHLPQGLVPHTQGSASLCVVCLSKQLYPALSMYQFSHKSLVPLKLLQRSQLTHTELSTRGTEDNFLINPLLSNIQVVFS